MSKFLKNLDKKKTSLDPRVAALKLTTDAWKWMGQNQQNFPADL